MPLDMDVLYRRVEAMVVGMPDLAPSQRLSDVLGLLRQTDPESLRAKLRQRERGKAKIPWLVAVPVDTLAGVFAAPSVPSDLSVVASDGSSIPPDRHSPVRYYVINVGYAVLTYGRSPNAILDAQEQFCFEEEELYFDPLGKRIPIEGTRLGILMGIAELVGLLEATRHTSSPMLALRDGSLILWNLQSEEQDFQSHHLSRFLDALNAFRQSSTAVTSYISFPGSHDVVNSLRVMLCDGEPGGCARCPQETEAQTLCRTMGGILDRQVFGALLRPGERSDVFDSQSAVLDQYKEHRIQFCYLNVGGEIARIEAPQWVMRDPEMLDLAHAAILDQCQRSGQYPPYPPVLIEAHEQAVISTADRQAVELLIEQVLAAKGVFYTRSAKDRSKLGRGV